MLKSVPLIFLPRTLLWTEMIVSDALVTHDSKGDTTEIEKLIGYIYSLQP